MSRNTPTKLKIFSLSYYAVITLLLSAVIAAPFLVTHKVMLTEKFIIGEDVLEAVLIVILFAIGFLISGVYRSELRKNRQEMNRLTCEKVDLADKLADAFHYIGGVNVQIQEIRSIFCGLRKYPDNDNDFRDIFDFYALKILGISNADWVVIRVIDRNSLKTVKEQIEFRGNAVSPNKHFSNKAILSNRNLNGCRILGSCQENLALKLVCILPKNRFNTEEKILLEAIVTQLEMLYIIFTSGSAWVRHGRRHPSP
jgi:hypothetical protein